MVVVKWCGHSYVIIETSDGVIAIDPHDGGSIGLPECRVEADVILLTHDHFDHNAVEHARGRSSRVIKWSQGKQDLGWLSVEGYEFYHDKAKGSLRGTVVAYKINLNEEGLVMVHMSDIGHVPTREDLREVRGADIAIVPVGGVITVGPLEAWRLVKAMDPGLVVPVHFWMPGMTLPLDPLDRFLNVSKARRHRVSEGAVDIRKRDIPDKTTILIFERAWNGARTMA